MWMANCKFKTEVICSKWTNNWKGVCAASLVRIKPTGINIATMVWLSRLESTDSTNFGWLSIPNSSNFVAFWVSKGYSYSSQPIRNTIE